MPYRDFNLIFLFHRPTMGRKVFKTGWGKYTDIFKMFANAKIYGAGSATILKNITNIIRVVGCDGDPHHKTNNAGIWHATAVGIAAFVREAVNV